MKTNPIKHIINITLLCLLMALQSYAIAEIKVTYYIPDASGSPVAATDEQGNVKWRKHYKPFGEEIEQGLASHNNHVGYTGHVHDRSTGLTYMGARYYDPVVGRFMAMDPAAVAPEDPRTFNRFAYANNNPYKFIDPDGRNPLSNRQFNRFANPNQLVDAGFGGRGVGVNTNGLPPGVGGVGQPSLRKFNAETNQIVSNRIASKLRNKLKRINNQTAAGGNRGVSGSVTEKDAKILGEKFVGKNFKIMSNGKGFVSADGLRTFRFPAAKKGINPATGEPFSKTGVQANFETKIARGEKPVSNVHLDVR